MQREKLKNLLENLEKEIEKAKTLAEKTHSSASEIARSAAGAFSQSGDIEHARNQADLNLKRLNDLNHFKKHIIQSLKDNAQPPTNIQPVCFITLRFENGEESEFCYVKNPVLISGVKFLSSSSPLGITISGKKAGDRFSLTNETGISTTGSISKID